ncbi:hypothetical protein SAMN05216601_110206 [Ectopseudomonas composti]|uniref:Uncharacterized protein n=1 Tax=Ectopseudomonas composti TaxID=658457 RepID=A0A1I5Q1A8_9GAMM|nr:hypothetical protein [Pseudomonas composti]SFP39790.1 hypothetical protein SAMN05216601_110206 [Pseudomonas composti]
MSDGIIGKATYKCDRCGAKHFLHDDDFCFEAESGSERVMGEETQYVCEVDEPCNYCNNEIHLKFEVWEYPVGIINMTNEDSSGAEILESYFEIYHAPPHEEHEEAVRLVKSLVLLRFDAFAETFVEFWVKSYKKSPRPTTMISILGALFSIIGLGFFIYTSEQARAQKLANFQSYSEQFELLRSTEKNLNDLSVFISSQKSEIEAAKSLIQDLETKKSELEPIVTANQDVVDAIFLQQRRDIDENIWVERGISFLLGILASLIATVIWHFVGRSKKEKSNRQR